MNEILISKGNIRTNYNQELTQNEERILNLAEKTAIFFNLSKKISKFIFHCYLTLSKHIKKTDNDLVLLAFSVNYISRKILDVEIITITEICHLYRIFDHHITTDLILENEQIYEKILAENFY